MKETIAEQMTALNQAYKEVNEAYHNYAKKSRLPDTGLWVLYSLWEHEGVYTQRELCADWSYTPQTVNSVLKNMEQQGYVQLQHIPGNRKSKQILLTSKGKALGKRIIAPLMQAECSSFSRLAPSERKTLLSTTKKHITLLRQEIERLPELSSEDCSPQ